MTTNDPILESLQRGCEALYGEDDLLRRLAEAAKQGRKLRIKLGLDPTAPDIHLGHTVVLKKVRQFQDLGHQAVIIIGDYTARVGDPTGVNKTRPILSPEQIDANAETYFAQAGKVLDTDPEKLEIRKNSEWLAKMNLADLLKLAGHVTVAQIMQRDTFKKRFASDVQIGIHEFFYPLMQAYDSVMVQADVELGGSDQTFNNLVGRDIQKAYGQPPQIVMIMPILVGLDGVEKMSKSKDNYIGVTDDPNDMFGKVMSIPDSLMQNYFTLLTDLPSEQIDELTDDEKTHPRKAKAELGRRIVAEFHSPTAAQAASDEFDRIFAKKDIPTDMPTFDLSDPSKTITDVLTESGLVDSRSQVRRLVKQNAITLDGQKITDSESILLDQLGQGEGVLKVGKRRFLKVEGEKA